MADLFSKPTNNPFNMTPPSTPFGGSPLGGGMKQNKNQIVTSLYKSVLGRDPDPNALMYYISQPEIDENAVRKQMIESEEHRNILEEFKNIAQLKKDIENLKVDVNIKEKKIGDKQLEIDELNKILAHKTNEITKVRSEVEQAKKDVESKTKFSSTISVVKVESLFDKIVKGLTKILRKN